MGISDEIEVATILEIKATIELPFQASLTTSVVCIDDQEICQKVCCTSLSEFLFFLFNMLLIFFSILSSLLLR